MTKSNFKQEITDRLTARQLLKIFEDETTISKMKYENFIKCYSILKDAVSFDQDVEYYAPNEDTRSLIGYCINYYLFVQVDMFNKIADATRPNSQVSPLFQNIVNGLTLAGHVRG